DVGADSGRDTGRRGDDEHAAARFVLGPLLADPRERAVELREPGAMTRGERLELRRPLAEQPLALPPLALEPLRLQAVLGRLLLAREQLLERHEAARVQLRVTSRMLLGERRAGILRREHRRSLRNLGPECRDRALERRALRALELAHAGA